MLIYVHTNNSAAGAGADIPSNADLVFEVELVAINGKRAFYTAEEKAKGEVRSEDGSVERRPACQVRPPC